MSLSKSDKVQAFGGSNPPLSAKIRRKNERTQVQKFRIQYSMCVDSKDKTEEDLRFYCTLSFDDIEILTDKLVIDKLDENQESVVNRFANI